MKPLLLGIAFIVLVGIAGFLYRNAVSKPTPVVGTACTQEAKLCPDGQGVGREGPNCTFAQCPPPNATLASVGIVFAVPTGYAADATLMGEDPALLAAYSTPPSGADAPPAQIIAIHDYPLTASTTLSDVLHATAIGDASGAPVAPSTFTAAHLGSATYTMAVLGRFEGVVHVAYYLPRAGDVLRFEAIDQNVMNWTDSNLDLTKLPANGALRAMLTTMQTN